MYEEDNMRYQKPVVMDLSAGVRASGQVPLSCFGGNFPGGLLWCGAGTSGTAPSANCVAGPEATGGPVFCANGLNTAPDNWCQGGAGAPGRAGIPVPQARA